jgi:hypothetical protein
MGVFIIIVLLVQVSILWLPAVLCALVLKRHFGAEFSRLLWLVLPTQLLIAVGLIFLTEYIGLLNPAGYVLGLTVLVSLAGAAVVVLYHRAANQSFQRTAPGGR